MAKPLIVICRFGGTFHHHENKNIYVGGEACGVEINDETSIDYFTSQVTTKCDIDVEYSLISLKYHIPGNDDVLITLRDTADLNFFVGIYWDSISAEIFVTNHGGDNIENRTTTSHAHTRNNKDNSEHEPRMIPLWRDVIIEVGQMFDGANEFRQSLRKYTIAHHFTYKFVKNDQRRVTATCKDENCRWKIHALRMQNTDVFHIKKFEKHHSCDPGIGQKTHPQASKKLVASIVQDKLRDTPTYRARDIVNGIQRDYGVSLCYQQAYRGKEIARQTIHGHAVWETTEDNRFQQLFISFHAQIVGFKNACRPLRLIDGTFGKEHYKVTILSAITIDANNQMYPLAFGVVLGETHHKWLWFLSNLKIILEGMRELTIISDRHPGLIDIVLEFSNCYHVVCVHHLSTSLMGALSGKVRKGAKTIIKGLVYATTNSVTIEEFTKNLNKIKKISPEAYDWLVKSEQYRWAEAYAHGCRFGQLTINVAESFNSWILEARGLPIMKMVNKIHD